MAVRIPSLHENREGKGLSSSGARGRWEAARGVGSSRRGAGSREVGPAGAGRTEASLCAAGAEQQQLQIPAARARPFHGS